MNICNQQMNATKPAARAATVSAVLDSESDISNMLFKKRDRWQTIRDVLPMSFLETLRPTALRSAVDGVYFVTAAEAEDIRRLAQELAKSGVFLSRLGRGSHLAELVKHYRSLM